MPAFTTKPTRPMVSKIGPAATIPKPMPSSVAASKRDTARPRIDWSPEVASAM